MTEPPSAPDSSQPSPNSSNGLVVEPLPYDGVASVAVGTGLWLVALVAMLPLSNELDADGHLWWIATAAIGFVLGLAGLWIVVRRRNRLRAAAAAPPTSR